MSYSPKISDTVSGLTLGLGLVLASGYAAAAPLTFEFADVASVGTRGGVGNDIRNYSSTSATTISGIAFTGTVSPQVDEGGEIWTTGDDLWMRVSADGTVVSDIQLGSGGELVAGDTAFSGSYNFTSSLGITDSTTLSFEFYELFDDNEEGEDAIWSNMAFTLLEGTVSPSTPGHLSATHLGTLGFADELFDISTLGDFDTMLGLFDAKGTLLSSIDAYADNTDEQLEGLSLGAGQYYVAAMGSGLGSFYGADAFGANVGSHSSDGSLSLTINGSTTDPLNLTSGEIAWFSFDVAATSVPEPSTLALLSIGLIGLLRRLRPVTSIPALVHGWSARREC